MVATNAPSRLAPIHLFPNPVSEKLTIASSNTGITRYELRSMTGKILKQGIFEYSGFAEMSAFPAGIYLLYSYRDGLYTGIEKVIKQ